MMNSRVSALALLWVAMLTAAVWPAMAGAQSSPVPRGTVSNQTIDLAPLRLGDACTSDGCAATGA